MNNNNNYPTISNEIRKKLQIYRTENIGPITYYKILKSSSLNEALDMIKNISLNWNKEIKIPSLNEIDEEINNHLKLNASILDVKEILPEFAFEDFPPLLSVMGNINLLKTSILGVVGTRLPSLQALQYTKYLCEGLGNCGYTLISGMAKGIDTIVHESSLKTGTIAVLPCGIDIIFPSVNLILYTKIRHEGLLICDRPFGQSAIHNNFFSRNKILANLAKCIIVTEATIHSGSLMTANFAEKKNKPIFSVPGHPLDSRYSGNNYLIKKGANLLDKYEDVIDYFNKFEEKKEKFKENSFELNLNVNFTMRKKVLNALSYIPVSIEELSIYLNMPIGEINYILLELEIIGKILILPNNYVSLI